MRALIGYTGFVGSNLLHAGKYDVLFNSRNSSEMRGKHFTEVICAGISAVKWKANKEPEADRSAIKELLKNLQHITADRFVLLSTTDVYQPALNVTESAPASCTGAPYGVNRAEVERFVAQAFARHLIIRLPALYGRGLKKNAIYDLRNDNMVEAIDPRGSFQWYDVRRLERDMETVFKTDLKLLNIAPEPVSMASIGDRYFPGKLGKPNPDKIPATYDMKTEHASLFGGSGKYHFDRNAVLDSIGSYIEGNE